MPSGSTYVPPHLRGRSGASSTPASSNSAGGSKSGSRSRSRSGSNTGSGSGSGGGNSGSRWKNLNNDEDASGYTPGHRGNHSHNHRHNRDSNANRHRTPRAGGNGQATAAAAAASGSGSRWANVDRSSIEAGGPSVSSNRYKKGDGYRRTNGHQQQHQHVRAIFFGDSFIKLFGLLNDYSDSVLKSPRKIEVHKYKAASAKGLCRDGNQNRADIRRIVHKLSRGGGSGSGGGSPLYPNLERLVFCFGSVDVHMSYYYKKYVQETPLSDDDLKAIARNYVDFVAGIEVTGSTRTLSKLVVGIYPSPLEDEHVGASLKAYGSLETDEQVETVDASDDRFADVRLDRVLLFNDALRERCEHHNNNNSDTDTNTNTTTHARLEYHDVLEEVLAPADEEGTRVVRDAYRDVSDLNIHLIHETILQLWVEKWPWYKALTLGADRGGRQQQQQHSSADFLEYLQKTFDDYRKTKPWAERTHVAETMGVQLSAT